MKVGEIVRTSIAIIYASALMIVVTPGFIPGLRIERPNALVVPTFTCSRTITDTARPSAVLIVNVACLITEG